MEKTQQIIVDPQETSRKIYLSGEINEGTIIPIIEKIDAINNEEKEKEQFLNSLIAQNFDPSCYDKIIINEPEPILLEINTVGGKLSYGFQLISAIQSSNVPIIGHVSGYCMSMGIPILSACDYRTATEYARFMIHDISMGAIGKFNDLESSVYAMKEERKVYIDFLVKNTNLNEEQVNEFINKPSDVNFGVKEAIEYGIIDNIIKSFTEEEYLEFIKQQELSDKQKDMTENRDEAVEVDNNTGGVNLDNEARIKKLEEEIKNISKNVSIILAQSTSEPKEYTPNNPRPFKKN